MGDQIYQKQRRQFTKFVVSNSIIIHPRLLHFRLTNCSSQNLKPISRRRFENLVLSFPISVMRVLVFPLHHFLCCLPSVFIQRQDKWIFIPLFSTSFCFCYTQPCSNFIQTYENLKTCSYQFDVVFLVLIKFSNSKPNKVRFDHWQCDSPPDISLSRCLLAN